MIEVIKDIRVSWTLAQLSASCAGTRRLSFFYVSLVRVGS